MFVIYKIKSYCNMGQKNKISNDITNLIKEFTEKYCSKCKSDSCCNEEKVLSCKEFNKFLEEYD